MSSIHQVAIKNTNAVGGADWVMKSRADFLGMPPADQIQLVLDGNVKFYDDQGGTVPAQEAIASIGLL